MQDNKKRIHAKKTRYAGLLLAVLLVTSGCTKKEELLLLSGEDTFADEETDRTEEVQAGEEMPAVPEENPDMIYVHVCGAVRQSGVYELKAGSRVYEAVQAAGGFAEGADQNYVNQAQELSDGAKLVIPTLEEAAAQENADGTGESNPKNTMVQIGIVADSFSAGAEDEGTAKDAVGKININTASAAQLCGIPGIGETRAAEIIAYRESHGGFQKPEDIMKVNGIKEGMYEKIKDSISVN